MSSTSTATLPRTSPIRFITSLTCRERGREMQRRGGVRSCSPRVKDTGGGDGDAVLPGCTRRLQMPNTAAARLAGLPSRAPTRSARTHIVCRPALVHDGQRRVVELLGKGAGAGHAAHIRGHHHQVAAGDALGGQVVQDDWQERKARRRQAKGEQAAARPGGRCTAGGTGGLNEPERGSSPAPAAPNNRTAIGPRRCSANSS